MADLPDSKNVKSNKLFRMLAFAVVFALALILMRVVFNQDKGSSDTSSETSQQSVKPYTSSDNKFTINFSGTTEVKNENIEVEGLPVQITTYINEASDTKKISSVTVSVYKEPDFDFNGDEKQRKVLEAAATDGAENSNAEVISLENTGKFLNNNSAQAELLAKKGSKEAKIYALYFLKKVEPSDKTVGGTTLYTIMTINQDKEKFDALINSFKFND